jgi:hypothetical protein
MQAISTPPHGSSTALNQRSVYRKKNTSYVKTLNPTAGDLTFQKRRSILL